MRDLAIVVIAPRVREIACVPCLAIAVSGLGFLIRRMACFANLAAPLIPRAIAPKIGSPWLFKTMFVREIGILHPPRTK